MIVLVPYTPVDPKTRLAPLLSPSERRAFAAVMLADVVDAVEATGHRPLILAEAAIDDPPAPVTVDDRPLSTAVNDALDPPMAVIMADMPLVTPDTLEDAFERPADVVIGPGLGGGTNLLVVRDERFTVDYHGTSLADHRHNAAAAGLSVAEVDSHRIAVDVDEPVDLVEVVLHGRGRAARWLEDRGFELVATEGRVAVDRT